MKDQEKNFVPDMTPSRRAVLAGVVGVGFAVAAGPAAASAITTDTAGLEVADVLIPTKDRTIPGYSARPAGGRLLPVVIVVQEIFGVHEHIRDVCRRLAKEGFLAIAPDLYVRQGDVRALASIDDVLEIVRTVPDEQVMADLDATVAFAGLNGGDAGKVGITGFCWGGRIVWLYAAHSATMKAGVAWYGRLVGEATVLTPAHPLDRVPAMKAPVLGLYGGKDTGILVSDVEKLRAAIKAAGKASVLHVYPDAQHGFHADYRPSYDAVAARDGFGRMLAWFRERGVG